MAKPEDAFSRTLDALEATLAPHAQGIAAAPRSTILPPQGDADTAGRRAIAALSVQRRESLGPLVAIEGTLGSGGMGIVRLATQLSMGRKVAVKTLKGSVDGEAAALSILREAWLMGSLEHPNIIPVYDVGLDSKGKPLIVLKRIEGADWSTLIGDAAAVRKRFGVDLLEWNLQTLLPVCAAVQFAHGKAIVHRDLKPQNVMIGEVGEVYVIDWGISVSLRPDPSGRLPHVGDCHDLAGTPAYMAPEMMNGDPSQLGTHTDVYLLGAIFYELLVGRAPHRTDSLEALIKSATQPPELPSQVPAVLADICARAMAPDPADRFADVVALSAAIKDAIRHQGSTRLAARAQLRLDELQTAAHAVLDDTAAANRMELYSLLAQCRFGFREALDAWPDNEAAKGGLQQAVTTMIEVELAAGNPDAAGLLLPELTDPPLQLQQRIADAAASEADELAALRHNAAQHDMAVGSRTRAFVIGTLGAIWTVFPLLGYLMVRPVPPWTTTAATSGFLLLTCGLGLWARESLTKTAINRGVFGSVVALLVVELLVCGVSWRMGLPPPLQHVLHVALWLTTCTIVAVTVDRRLVVAAVGYGAALVATALYPSTTFAAMALANLLLTVTAVLAWRPRQLLTSSASG
ncbi:MAG: serine/threonine protein kinase [Nannocystaceae bacterium]|nr:serine/threonine protein kinase [Nannocystaceae bacterium]